MKIKGFVVIRRTYPNEFSFDEDVNSEKIKEIQAMKKLIQLKKLVLLVFAICLAFMNYSCNSVDNDAYYEETMSEIEDAFERAKAQPEDNSPKESVRGNWNEDDLIEAGNIADGAVRNEGVFLNEGSENICKCIVKTIEKEFDGPNDPTMTESNLEPIITNCVDTYYVIDPGGC